MGAAGGGGEGASPAFPSRTYRDGVGREGSAVSQAKRPSDILGNCPSDRAALLSPVVPAVAEDALQAFFSEGVERSGNLEDFRGGRLLGRRITSSLSDNCSNSHGGRPPSYFPDARTVFGSAGFFRGLPPGRRALGGRPHGRRPFRRGSRQAAGMFAGTRRSHSSIAETGIRIMTPPSSLSTQIASGNLIANELTGGLDCPSGFGDGQPRFDKRFSAFHFVCTSMKYKRPI